MNTTNPVLDALLVLGVFTAGYFFGRFAKISIAFGEEAK